MGEQTEQINIIKLLMDIKADVSSIKTDMTNFKETQKVEKENTMKDIADVRSDCKRELKELEARVMTKLNGIQSVQNNLVGDVDTLKHAEEKKDAKRWKTVMAFIGTSVGSMILVKIPDFIAFCIEVSRMGGN
jgi:hypothetical protein